MSRLQGSPSHRIQTAPSSRSANVLSVGVVATAAVHQEDLALVCEPHTVIFGLASSFTVVLAKEVQVFRSPWPELCEYTSTPSMVTFCVIGMDEFALLEASAGAIDARRRPMMKADIAVSCIGTGRQLRTGGSEAKDA
eukprot:CAMPEP_0185902188 /NCGR_PEP_ID=MMETSP0196C-20130402/1466_1 /TAXON_ID=2932 /ORGANISM="Alexandrium fundyense, Strain CCMP1719" /LENGTH=137 /DNA_ID=CAMNT_0028620985 /DNA_START=140 /DNA_END=555 /DNA_ORIENTATION=-